VISERLPSEAELSDEQLAMLSEVAAAVGEGSIAVRSVHDYLALAG
jgi:hypothetical protein